MLSRTLKFLKAIHQDEGGAMAVEKILLIALIALPIVIILAIFREKIVSWFSKQDQDLSNYAPS